MNLLILHAPSDEALRDELRVHLGSLRRAGVVIDCWHRGLVAADANRSDAVKAAFLRADLIVMLISADLIEDEETLVEAARRCREGGAHVIPVLLRACTWPSAWFDGLRPLPQNGQPVTQWSHRDAAWAHVATEIQKVVAKLAVAPRARTLPGRSEP